MRMEQTGKLDGVLKCNEVSKSFTTNRGVSHIIDKISLNVEENEFIVLFGPGQCGKTTLMNMLSGLEKTDSGTVYMEEKVVENPHPDRGVIFQSMALFDWLTVMGNVSYGPKVRGVKKKEREERAKYFIDLVGLEGFEHSYINKLSGGMKQRVGIARAYCNDPKILFMDEPFSALDAQTRYLMQEEIIRIWSKEKKTIVFITNNIEEAVYLADRIVLLTNCPATVKEEYIIDLPRPRDYTSDEFLQLRDKITKNMDKTL